MGNLPPGVHTATWDELADRFGATHLGAGNCWKDSNVPWTHLGVLGVGGHISMGVS